MLRRRKDHNQRRRNGGEINRGVFADQRVDEARPVRRQRMAARHRDGRGGTKSVEQSDLEG